MNSSSNSADNNTDSEEKCNNSNDNKNNNVSKLDHEKDTTADEGEKRRFKNDDDDDDENNKYKQPFEMHVSERNNHYDQSNENDDDYGDSEMSDKVTAAVAIQKQRLDSNDQQYIHEHPLQPPPPPPPPAHSQQHRPEQPQGQDGFVLSVLLEQLYTIALESGYDAAEAVSIVKAKNILEATDHDVALALQLYWDDFLATSQHHRHHHQDHPLPPPPPPPPPMVPPVAAIGRGRLHPPYNQRQNPPPALNDPVLQRLQPPNDIQYNMREDEEYRHNQELVADLIQSAGYKRDSIEADLADIVAGVLDGDDIPAKKRRNKFLEKLARESTSKLAVAGTSILRRRLEPSFDEHVPEVQGKYGTNAANNDQYSLEQYDDSDEKPQALDSMKSGSGSGTKRQRKEDLRSQRNKHHRRAKGTDRRHRRGSSSSLSSGSDMSEGEQDSNEKVTNDNDDNPQVGGHFFKVRTDSERRRLSRNVFEKNDRYSIDECNNDAPGEDDGVDGNVNGNRRPFDDMNEGGHEIEELGAAAIVAAGDDADFVVVREEEQEPSASVSDDEAAAAMLNNGPHSRRIPWRSTVPTDNFEAAAIKKGNSWSSRMTLKSTSSMNDIGGKAHNPIKQSVVHNKDNDGEKDVPSSKRNKNTQKEDEDDGYLSDNDWLWDVGEPRDAGHPVQPSDILWSGITFSDLKKADELPMKTKKLQEINGTQHAKEQASLKHLPKWKRQLKDIDSDLASAKADDTKNNVSDSNMIAVDVEEDLSVDHINDNVPVVPGVASNDLFDSIPFTWLNAGFQFSDGTDSSTFGLVLHPPREEDVSYNAWKSCDLWRGNARNCIPPPYHCRGITALLSIVNGLLYTGVCIPATGRLNSGNSNGAVGSARKPLVDVTMELEEFKKQRQEKQQRELESKRIKTKKEQLKEAEHNRSILIAKTPSKRDLEARLADALTSLLSIAIRASIERKNKILESLKDTTDPVLKRKVVNMKKALHHLCPTTWWDEDNLRLYRENSGYHEIHINVSYTNIDDIRSYVLANLQAFMSSGGCALFMETIFRIHGKGAILRMMRSARKKNGGEVALEDENETGLSQNKNTNETTCSSTTKPARLVWCTCAQRHRQALETNALVQRPRNVIYDTTPESHDCISIEMISLLLTGRVYTSLQGWSTGPIGLGLLSTSDIPGQHVVVDKSLTRPEKPVWILRGPTCYSTLWLNGCNDHSTTFSRYDDPLGSVAQMTHFNSWYNIRHSTRLRLITNRNNTEQQNQEQFGSTKLSRILLSSSGTSTNQTNNNIVRKIAQIRYTNAIIAKEMAEMENIDPSMIVSQEEMDSMIIHPDDPKYYRTNYRLWRYRFVSNALDKNKDNDDIEQRQQQQGSTIAETKTSSVVTSINDSENNTKKATEETTNDDDVVVFDDDCWRPYHRLNDREQWIVETKLGPKINLLLWTRWPRATIDRYEPNDPQAVV